VSMKISSATRHWRWDLLRCRWVTSVCGRNVWDKLSLDPRTSTADSHCPDSTPRRCVSYRWHRMPSTHYHQPTPTQHDDHSVPVVRFACQKHKLCWNVTTILYQCCREKAANSPQSCTDSALSIEGTDIL